MIGGSSKLACEGATRIMNEVHDIMIGGPSKPSCEGATRIMNEVHDIKMLTHLSCKLLRNLGYAIVNGRKGIGGWDGNIFYLIWTER